MNICDLGEVIEPTEGTKIYFSHFTLLDLNVKNCFVTNTKTSKVKLFI